MKLTHFGHACVLVETDEGRRALLDPGTYSQGFENLDDLDLVLITHAHPDHVDAGRLSALREANPHARLIANAEVVAQLDDQRAGDRMVTADEVFEEGGIRVHAISSTHAQIYPSLPDLANTGYILADSVWHPGDSFDVEARQVDVLLLPIGGPWMRIADAIDFAKAVAPRVLVPIHQAGLADVHRQLHYGLLQKVVPNSDLVILTEGVAHEV